MIVLTDIFTLVEPTGCTIVSIVFGDAASNDARLEYARFLRVASKEAFARFASKDTEVITRTGIITHSTGFRLVGRF